MGIPEIYILPCWKIHFTVIAVFWNMVTGLGGLRDGGDLTDLVYQLSSKALLVKGGQAGLLLVQDGRPNQFKTLGPIHGQFGNQVSCFKPL